MSSRESASGGKSVGDIDNGDWIAFKPYVLSNAKSLTARVASAGAGGKLEVRAGSPTGRVLGRATVPATGGWDTYEDVTASLSHAPHRTTTLYLVFKGAASGDLYEVDDFAFTTG